MTHYVEKAVDMMCADLGAELLVADLAAAVHVSRYHFARTFASVTGVPPHRYLYRLRMAEACRLLATTDRVPGGCEGTRRHASAHQRGCGMSATDLLRHNPSDTATCAVRTRVHGILSPAGKVRFPASAQPPPLGRKEGTVYDDGT